MMSKLSLLDKLKILGDVTSSSNLFAVAIVILLAIAILLIVTSTKKINKFICIAIYSSLIIVSLIFYKKEILEMFDYMMDNFFIAIYFPNLAIYFAAILTTNIILWVSILNKQVTKWIRAINTVMFCIIHYLLILIINIITKNEIDIFNQTSIYQNKNVQALIELSSTIFIIWILFLIIYKIIRIYQHKKEEEYETQEESGTSWENKTVAPTIQKEIIYKKQFPEKIRKTEAPMMVYGNIKKKKEEQPTSPSIVDFMKASIENDNNYLMDIPNFIVDDTPQILDTMLKSSSDEIFSEKKIPKEKNSIKEENINQSGNHQEKAKKESKITWVKEPDIATKSSSIKKQPKTNTATIKQQANPTPTAIFDNLLTLEDYKKVLKVLKDYKENEKNQAKIEQREETKNISFNDLQQLMGRK